MKEVVVSKKNKVAKWLYAHRGTIAVVAVCTLVIAMTCYGASADALWTSLKTVIEKWVKRMGAAVIFVGGIMFALGWKSDDAEQKSRGISTIIAGALVMAVAALTSTFFA